MAGAKKTSRALPRPHKFVAALQKQPNASKVIRGFVGRARSTQLLRVYLDAELRRYVEIPKKDILHFEDSRAQHGATASVVLWVDEKSRIHHFGNWFASEDPSTMATGEEGGGDPTTMATGEESTGFENPLDVIGNPFGRF